jgi:hypothetical protein
MKYGKLLAVLMLMLFIGSVFVSVLVTADFAQEPLAGNGGWSTDVRITVDPGISMSPKVVLDSEGSSHMVWADDRSGKFEIFYEKKSATGHTLIDDRQLTVHESNTTDYLSPKIVIDSNSCLYVMWFVESPTNYDLQYMKLDTDGNVLIEEISLNVDLRYVNDNYDFAVATEGSITIHVVFIGPEEGSKLFIPPMPTEVWYTKIQDTGETLVDPISLTYSSPYSFAAYRKPRIAIDAQDNIHVAVGWFLGDPDTPDFAGSFIHYMKLDNQGAILVSDTRLTPNFSGENWYSGIVFPHPRISVDSDDNVFIIWEDKRNRVSVELYYTKLDNNGLTLIDDTPLTNVGLESGGNLMVPDLAIDIANNLHIVWSDYRNEDDDPEIYYTSLNNSGQTVAPVTRLTNSSGVSSVPSVVAASEDMVRVIWQDARDGNNEIYYKQRFSSVLCGDINGDGIVNIGDVISFINRLFRNPSVPIGCEGDVNGDGIIHIGDVVYLINYLFKDGPPPVADCCA